ncbi:MAG: VCBS repeat-containing protein, partial [Phycisphaerales bacterium]|nr:VCBS repeat-containing protein [Phycisphaerales bacterium]
DGDLDVLAAARGANTISWFSNDGGADPVFARSIISSEPDGPWSVYAADVDGDGDIDVLSASSNDSTIGWHENTAVAGVELAAPGTSIRSTGGLALVNKSMRVGPTSTIEAASSLSVDRSSSLSGAGVARAPLMSSSGSVVPDPGESLTLDGLYEQYFDDGVTGLRSGVLRIGLGSGTPSVLDVTGSVALAGSLTVTADPGFDPPEGTVFTIITTGVPVGAERFDAAFLPGLPGGRFLRVVYDLGSPGGVPEGPGGSVSLVVATLGEDLGLGAPDDLTVAGVPNSAALADMNADGLPDVVLVAPDDISPQGAPGSVLVLLNGGEIAGVWQGFTGGVIQTPSGIDPSSVAVGQLDGVTGPDVAVANREDGTVRVLLNDGAGTLTMFADVAFNESPASVVIGDLDEDGLNDVAAAGSAVDATGLL